MRRGIAGLAAMIHLFGSHRHTCRLFTIGIITVGFGITEVSASTIISALHTNVIVRDSVGDQASSEDYAYGIALPYYTERTASTLGGTNGSVLNDFTTNGDKDRFCIDIDFHRSGNVDSQANSYAEIYFQVTEQSSFDFAGTFSLEGAGRISVQARLRDLSISGGGDGFIYYSQQLSENTADQVFHIGGVDGDTSNTLLGTLPGVLLPGHEYLMQYGFDIVTPVGGDAGANAHGLLDFSIITGSTSPNAVPAPSSLACLVGVGVMMFGMEWWKKRKTSVSPPDLSPAPVPEPASLAVWSFLAFAGIGGAWCRKRRSL